MRNYGTNDVSKHLNIASINVATCKYRIMRPWSHELLTVIFVFFMAKYSLEFFREIALKNFEKPSIPQFKRCTSPVPLKRML